MFYVISCEKKGYAMHLANTKPNLTSCMLKIGQTAKKHEQVRSGAMDAGSDGPPVGAVIS